MFTKFVKVACFVGIGVLAVKVLFSISTLLGVICCVAGVVAVIWNGLSNDGWFGSW